MPIKINNTYIIERMDDIPVKDMQVGQQIMLVEPREDKETQTMVDKITNMALDRIDMKIIYKFATVIHQPVIVLDTEKFNEASEALGEDAVDDLSIEEYGQLALSCAEGVDYEVERNIDFIEMIKFGDKLFHLQVNDDREFDPKKPGYKFSFGAKESTRHQKLYERIFGWSSNWRADSGTYTEQGIFTQYFSLPIYKDEYAMAFVIDHDIHAEYRFWNTNQHIYLIHKDGEIIEIQSKFNYIYELVKKYNKVYGSDKEFAKFDEVLFAHDYDIRDLIKDKGQGLYRVKKLFLEQDMDIYKQLDKFYSPYFIEDEISVYPDSVRGYNRSPRLVKNGEEVGWRSEEKYPEHYRVGEAMTEFSRYHGKGVNPETGKIINDDKMVIDYADDEGMIITIKDDYRHNDKSTYIKKLGHFIRADHRKDEIEIKELKERKKLVEMMATAQPINKVV